MTRPFLFDIVRKESPKILEVYLTENEIDVDIQDICGNTPLMIACSSNAPLVQTLIDAGADVDIQDICGKTALMIAIKRQPKVVVPLINTGANINITNSNGMTALMCAARDRPNAVQPLIDAGANITARTKTGWTALMYAAKYQSSSVQPLINAGANVQYAIDNIQWDHCKNFLRRARPRVLTYIHDGIMHHITLLDSKYCKVKLLGLDVDETREDVRYILDGDDVELFWSPGQELKMNN